MELPDSEKSNIFGNFALREKCPDMEFFLVGIQENADQKKIPSWKLFTQCKRNINIIRAKNMKSSKYSEKQSRKNSEKHLLVVRRKVL